jgi:methyltransferase
VTVVSPLYAVVGFLVAQRLAELALARRNHRVLLDRGAIEAGERHYFGLVALHSGWLLALLVMIDPQAQMSVPLLVVFGLLQCVRLWVIVTLGTRWTTRVMVIPGATRIRSGPYRFFDHPNYLVVCGEIAVVPLIFGAWTLAVVASALNLLLLRKRLVVENKALAEVYDQPSNG